MPWQKSFQQRFRWKRWCRLRAAPELFPWPGHTTGICFFVPFLMAVTVLDVASHSATSGMGGGHLPPPPAAATCPPWGQMCHQLCPLPCRHVYTSPDTHTAPPSCTSKPEDTQAPIFKCCHPTSTHAPAALPQGGTFCFAKAMQGHTKHATRLPAFSCWPCNHQQNTFLPQFM